MADVVPLPMHDVLTLVASALCKIDLWGRRGATMLSVDEIEALAILAALVAPNTRFNTASKEL